MTICIATSNYSPEKGGIATYSSNLATLLSNAGHKAIVLTIDINASADESDTVDTDKNGVFIIRLKRSYNNIYNHYKKYFSPGGINAPYWIAMGLAMQDWIASNKDKYKIDIIEASAFGGIGYFLTKHSFPPILLSGHGAFFQYKRFNNNKSTEQTKLIKNLERFAFTNADGIISHSPQSRKDIEQFTDSKIYLAKFPFFPKKEVDTEIKSRAESLNKYALVVGGLQKLKGPFVLFDAFRQLNKSNSELIIRWAGTDNYHHESGQHMSSVLANRYPDLWNKKIIWEKEPDDKKLASLYQNASFIIIPTIWESYNVISIEASFFKKAIIITETTGSSFLFSNEENALVIKADAPDILADAIEELNNSPELCNKLGEAAYKMIYEHLDSDKIVEERISIYKQAIHQRTLKEITFNTSLYKKYTSPYRKVYFAGRQLLKRIIKN